MALTIPYWLRRAIAHPLVTALAATWRIGIVNEQYWGAGQSSGRPTVYIFWHEVILPLLWHHRNRDVVVVVSDSQDGDYASDLAVTLGYRVVRGSSSKGAARALLAAVRELQSGHSVAFSPDGPRGPRRELKPGALAAAQRAKALVVPVHAVADRAWQLNSWDRFVIPKPFAHIELSYGQPVSVDPGPEGLAAGSRGAARVLAELVREGNGKKTP